jgi:hypothetical protein
VNDAPPGLWAVTTFFNPAGFRRKKRNFRLFRRHLGLPLVAVELAHDGAFELGSGDAEILVQLTDADVMWQKERLLNHALDALPPTCTTVIWVDCDIIFEADDWRERTAGLLDRFALVQPFSEVLSMPPEWLPGDPVPRNLDRRRPLSVVIGSGTAPDRCIDHPPQELNCAPGLVWAAHRGFVERHGFYDACIVGGGDSAFAGAAYGCLDAAMSALLMNDRRRQHYAAWAHAMHDSVRASVGHVDGRVFHLWHGATEDRGYRQRHEGLAPFDFDPFEDIAVADHGPWRWSSDKPGMHAFVEDYFRARREDG